MPTRVLWEPQVVLILGHGELSVSDIHQHNNIVYNDPRFKEIDSMILDFSDVTSTTITTSDVSIMASSDHIFGQLDHPRRMAIISKPNTVLRKLTEHYQHETMDTSLTISFFDNRISARNWLSWEIVNHWEIN